jgi:hypothetical protein
MNKQLYDSFKKLNDTAKSEITFKLKDSPVGLLLFEFLDKCENRNLKNRDVVKYIYKNELENTPYNVLENRFFKLRKKFIDEYLEQQTDHNQILADEEVELAKCKQLLSANEKEQAYKKLLQLESVCWERNIFELLPGIIDQMIFCNQSTNKLERNESLYPRLEKAILLQSEINRVIMLARLIYEINYKKGIKHAKSELSEMKAIANKYKDYSRFAMCYHNVALYYKLGSTDYVNDMQVISRHFKQFKSLNEKQPLIPLVAYRKNYLLNQQFHIRQINTFYYFNRCEFENAHTEMKNLWDNVHQNPDYAIFKTDSIYFNMLSAQRGTQRHAEAMQTIDTYIDFLKGNSNQSTIAYAYTLRAIIYCESYPRTFNLDVNFLQKKTDEYIRNIKNNNNVQTSLGEVFYIKAKMHFLNKEYSKALSILKSTEAKTYCETIMIYDIVESLFAKKDNLDIVKRKINKVKYKVLSPQTAININWLDRMLKNSMII